MIKLELTKTQLEEILHCLRTSYLDYDERLGVAFNSAIESYNNSLDELINTIKQRIEDNNEN